MEITVEFVGRCEPKKVQNLVCSIAGALDLEPLKSQGNLSSTRPCRKCTQISKMLVRIFGWDELCRFRDERHRRQVQFISTFAARAAYLKPSRWSLQKSVARAAIAYQLPQISLAFLRQSYLGNFPRNH
jgi:hypothetical protein